jgi:hypothetical protein
MTALNELAHCKPDSTNGARAGRTRPGPEPFLRRCRPLDDADVLVTHRHRPVRGADTAIEPEIVAADAAPTTPRSPGRMVLEQRRSILVAQDHTLGVVSLPEPVLGHTPLV